MVSNPEATRERSLTSALATFASRTSFDDLPDDLVETLKLATLNILACCLGGSQTRIGRMHVELARELGAGSEQATIVGEGARVSLPFAVYANGNLAFALDYEDRLFAVAHPGFAAVSASLALAEQRQLSGREFLSALAVGYETTARIALTMQPSHARARRVWGQQFHPFASASAATNILGLTPAEAEVALGIASTYATVPSVYKYFGPVRDTRPIREVKQGWGWVAMGGLMAALSAQKGFRGGLGALDGEFGFWSMAGSDRFDPERGLDGLGTEWLTREIEYKLHPSIGINHP
ncbi:MAG: MmgE/PrpD family protein, partial [Gaiellaceae bacterium]